MPIITPRIRCFWFSWRFRVRHGPRTGNNSFTLRAGWSCAGCNAGSSAAARVSIGVCSARGLESSNGRPRVKSRSPIHAWRHPRPRHRRYTRVFVTAGPATPAVYPSLCYRGPRPPRARRNAQQQPMGIARAYVLSRRVCVLFAFIIFFSWRSHTLAHIRHTHSTHAHTHTHGRARARAITALVRTTRALHTLFPLRSPVRVFSSFPLRSSCAPIDLIRCTVYSRDDNSVLLPRRGTQQRFGRISIRAPCRRRATLHYVRPALLFCYATPSPLKNAQIRL